jgi:hypothetical protein
MSDLQGGQAAASGYGPGGYGGPPGGGYGPPGGGYGPPPGGGGFGGPPPGASGPPMAQPPGKGPNIGLIIGLGCLGLFVVAGVVGAVAIFTVKRRIEAVAAAGVPATPIGGAPATPTTPAGRAALPASVLKAELRDLRDFKGDFGKSHHFVGELYNTGDDPIGFPSAKVTLLDASNTAVDSGICASSVRLFRPGEKVPCTFSTFKADTYATSKVEINPMRSYYTGQLADLKVGDIKFTPKAGYSPHQIDGKITNGSPFRAKSVWALVSLYGADGKIVGAEQTMVAGSDLDAGQAGLFSAKIYNVAAPPQTYEVKAIGYSE